MVIFLIGVGIAPADTKGKIALNAYLVSFLVHQKLIYVRLNNGSNERKILLPYFSHTYAILTG